MAEIMRKMFLVAFLLLHAGSVEGYEFRLLPTNLQDTEGFVEIFYNGSWGLIGRPEFQFSDATASLLCRKLNLSLFGYGASYIHQETNTFSYFWLITLECNGNKHSIDECIKTDEFRRTSYIEDVGQWLRDYGSKLYCVDYRLMGGLSQNTGMLLAAFSGTEHSMCYQGFDSSAGNVVCKHLRYNGLVAFNEGDQGDQGSIRLFNNKLTCTGNERSLNECTMSKAVIESCTRAVYITCKAVRLTSGNEYNNEGIVEIFFYGSWRYVKSCRFGFNDITEEFLCKTLGFRNVGYNSRHRLSNSDVPKVWSECLSCNGTEADIMQCEGASSFDVAYDQDYHGYWQDRWKAVWLYCFDTDLCQSNPCLNNGTCVDGKRSYTCNCNERWRGINCEIDTVPCQSNPCLNNGTCVDGKRSYTCNCTERWRGINCEIDIDECLYQPCQNNGACINAINGFVCFCAEGYKGDRCQDEVGDQTTLEVVLISLICVLSIFVLATLCCCLRYRRKHKKTKTDASNVFNSGKGGLQNTKEVESVQPEMEEGHYNEDVYDGIKESTVTDVADYIHPVTDVELPRDADDYVKFADNDQSVGYYKLKHTKTEDYSKLSGQKF